MTERQCYIGKNHDSAESSFTGVVHMLKIYSSALSDAQVNAAFAASVHAYQQAHPPPVTALFTIDGTGVVLGDTSGNAFLASDECITDGMGVYGAYESATITAVTGGYLNAKGVFHTEDVLYDYFTINGSKYGGTSFPSDLVLAPGETFTWYADGSIHKDGFTLCISTSPLAATPVPSVSSLPTAQPTTPPTAKTVNSSSPTAPTKSPATPTTAPTAPPRSPSPVPSDSSLPTAQPTKNTWAEVVATVRLRGVLAADLRNETNPVRKKMIALLLQSTTDMLVRVGAPDPNAAKVKLVSIVDVPSNRRRLLAASTAADVEFSVSAAGVSHAGLVTSVGDYISDTSSTGLSGELSQHSTSQGGAPIETEVIQSPAAVMQPQANADSTGASDAQTMQILVASGLSAVAGLIAILIVIAVVVVAIVINKRRQRASEVAEIKTLGPAALELGSLEDSAGFGANPMHRAHAGETKSKRQMPETDEIESMTNPLRLVRPKVQPNKTTSIGA